jgi:hypothetical protein
VEGREEGFDVTGTDAAYAETDPYDQPEGPTSPGRADRA